jgi:hypothetical protein
MYINSQVSVCQAHMGATGCILSYLEINGLTIQGLRLAGHLPEIGDPRVWLLGTWACAEPGHNDE